MAVSTRLIRATTALFSRNSPRIRHFSRNVPIKPTCGVVLQSTAVAVRVRPSTSYGTVRLTCRDPQLKLSMAEAPDDDCLAISVLGDESGCHVVSELEVELPIHFSTLNVTVRDAGLTLDKVYTTASVVCTARDVWFEGGVKCSDIAISAAGGDISCAGSLLATAVAIETSGKGTVRSSKGILHADRIAVKVEEGDVDLAAVYSNFIQIDAGNSHVRLANVHGSCQVTVAGTGGLKIVGLDGSLRARVHRGLADIHISRLASESNIVDVQYGNVLLKFADNVKCRARLEGLGVKVEDGIEIEATGMATGSNAVVYEGTINGGSEEEPLVCASARNGTVTTSIQSWADGLKTIV